MQDKPTFMDVSRLVLTVMVLAMGFATVMLRPDIANQYRELLIACGTGLFSYYFGYAGGYLRSGPNGNGKSNGNGGGQSTVVENKQENK